MIHSSIVPPVSADFLALSLSQFIDHPYAGCIARYECIATGAIYEILSAPLAFDIACEETVIDTVSPDISAAKGIVVQHAWSNACKLGHTDPTHWASRA